MSTKFSKILYSLHFTTSAQTNKAEAQTFKMNAFTLPYFSHFHSFRTVSVI